MAKAKDFKFCTLVRRVMI